MRKIAKIVKIDSIEAIPNADSIEACKVGGWKVVTKKGQFKKDDLGVYFEIDCFLPDGNAAWQFLVDKSSIEDNGKKGHVLRTSSFRGQISQGFLIDTNSIPAERLIIGEDVSDILGVYKYEKPIPKELLGKARGMFPSNVPKTDEERIQNIESTIIEKADKLIEYEITEKLEGESTSYIWLDQELHVCSRSVDYYENNMPSWKIAKDLNLTKLFELYFGNRNVAIQGEIIGPGVEDNIYNLSEHSFHCYKIYDIDQGKYLSSKERIGFCQKMNISHVPILGYLVLNKDNSNISTLLEMADGKSLIHPEQRREGLVYKEVNGEYSFKTISNEYLMKGARKVKPLNRKPEISYDIKGLG